MSTKFKQNVQISGEINATKIVGDGSGLTNVAGAYTDSDVDTHLNQSNPTAGYVLTWNGVDYSWTANGTGAGLGDVVDDITPQLGGNLDLNSNDITGTGNISITGSIDNNGYGGQIHDLQISTMGFALSTGIRNVNLSGSGITNYALLQNNAGNTFLNAQSGNEIYFRNNNNTIMQLDGTSLKFINPSNIKFVHSNTTTLDVVTPTTDRTINLPDASGTVLLADGDGSNLTNVQASSVQVTETSDDNVAYNVLFSDTAGTANVQMTPIQDDNGLVFNPYSNQLSVGSVYFYSNGGVVFEGSNDAYETTLNVIDPTADRNIYLPDASGNVVLDGTLNASIDTHLNQSNPTSGYVLSWNGSDYAWVVNNGTVFDLVQDLTPQLGGNLDTNGANISFGDTATPGTDDTLSFGADNDLQIYHNTSDGHNYMQLNDKRLYIKAVDDGLTGPQIIFDHETTSPSTVDFSTVLAATSRDSAGASQTIGQITFGTPNVTSGSYRGSIRFDVTDSGGLVEYVRLDGNSDIIDLKKAVRFSSAFTFPTTDGTANQVLQTNGSGVVTWATVSGGGGSGTPGGSNTEVQFNNAGSFDGDSDFTYNSTTNVLTVGSIETNSAGTPTITSNSAVNISVGSSVVIQKNSGGGGFRLGNLTTTERNALTSANGEMIYNTTDNKLQGYENGSWTNLIGSGTYSDSNVDAHLNQSNPTSGYVLSWNGSDYAWVTNAGGGGMVDLVDDTTPQLGGNLDTNNKNIVFGDSSGTTVNRLKFGAGSDLEIYHNGSNSIIQTTNTHTFKLMVGTSNYITATPSNALSIYHGNGSKKFETTTTGVKTTGTINVNGAYSLPTAVGTSGQVLAVPSSGSVLEFVNSGGGGSTAADDITVGDAAVNIATTTGNITIDAQGNDTDIIFKGTDGGTDVTFLTFIGSTDTAKFETDKVQFQLAPGAMAAQMTDTSIAFYRDVSLIKPVGYGSVELIFQEAGDYKTTISHTSPASQDQTITLPDATGTVLTTGNSDTPTTTTSSSDADFVLIDDGGTMKKITPTNLGIGGGMSGDKLTITAASAPADPSSGEAFIYSTQTSGDTGIQIHASGSSEVLRVRSGNSTTNLMYLNNQGNVEFNGYVRASYFEDRNNTSFYADLGSTTTSINVAGNILFRPDGSNSASAKSGARNVFNIVNSGANHYQYSDPDSHWFTSPENDPIIYLRRGETYYFVVNASGHPFEIRSSQGGSTYNNGVTNNGAQVGTIVFKVPMSAPSTLYYVCSIHSSMGNTINIV